MDAVSLKQALEDLEMLSKIEYHQSLGEVLSDTDDKRTVRRLGRLIGVKLKEPFSRTEDRMTPSSSTGAYRSHELVDRDAFERQSHTPEYRALEIIKREVAPNFNSVYDLAEYAQVETGFFGYLARDLRKYVCGDRKLRDLIDQDLKSATTGKVKIPNVTPESVVAAGGFSLGTLLVQHVPVMGIVGAPMVAAVVVIIYRIGVNAFCDWSDDLRTDEDEKHYGP